jgi:hypothetical protein
MQHSTTQPRIAVIPQQPVVNRSIFVVALALCGLVSFLAGVANLTLAIIQLSNGFLPGVGSTELLDAAFDLTLGALILGSLGAFVKGRILSIWLYAGSLLASLVYQITMGYPPNYLFLGFGFLLVWQLLKFRNELDLR